jgi:hypothetical protein
MHDDPIEAGARALAERRLPGSSAPGDLYETDAVTTWRDELRKDAGAVRDALHPRAAGDAVIFDIDGTLADVEHRRHLVEGERPDWRAFNAAIGDDRVHPNVHRLAATMRSAGHAVVLCSGRDAKFRRLTELWLTFNEVRYDALYMRPEGDQRKDHVVKLELLDRILADGWRSWLVVDDRSSVVEAWRSRGLTCLQCAPGDF